MPCAKRDGVGVIHLFLGVKKDRPGRVLASQLTVVEIELIINPIRNAGYSEAIASAPHPKETA